MQQIILKTINDLYKWKKNLGANINFVPTMGNLHKGHLELIHQSNKDGSNKTLVSIFINPLQFNDKRDFKNYPKQLKRYSFSFYLWSKCDFFTERKRNFKYKKFNSSKSIPKIVF